MTATGTGSFSRRIGRWAGRHKYASIAYTGGLIAIVVALARWAPDVLAWIFAIAVGAGFFFWIAYSVVQVYREEPSVQALRQGQPSLPWWRLVLLALRDFAVAVGQGLGALITGVTAVVEGLVGVLVALAFFLGGLFILIWIIKRMWEAA